jgi:transcriptional regulator with XRE-family HTH domain
MNYGERLKFARKMRGYSQIELAKRSGVGQGSISKIERGDQDGSTFDADLSMTLKINPMWLSRGIGEMECGDISTGLSVGIPVIDDESWRSFSPVIRVFIEEFAIKAKNHIIDDNGVRLLQGMIDVMANNRQNTIHA